MMEYLHLYIEEPSFEHFFEQKKNEKEVEENPSVIVINISGSDDEPLDTPSAVVIV